MEDVNDPDKPTIWKEAKDHIEHGNYDKAVEIYKYLLIRFNENGIVVERANANLGDIYLTLKQFDLAESHIKKAIQRNPGKPDYHYLLGSVYSTQSSWPKAIHEFEIVLENDPNNAEALCELGWAELKSGNKARGMELFFQAQVIDPLDANILLHTANAHLFEMDFKEAKRYAQGAMLLDPENALAKEVFDKICRLQKELER